jgi:hypothetical protein
MCLRRRNVSVESSTLVLVKLQHIPAKIILPTVVIIVKEKLVDKQTPCL